MTSARNVAHTRLSPGATIAILGGGSMGRLTTLAARELGYRVHVLEGDPECTSADIADRSIVARANDLGAVCDIVRDAQVVTTSVESVPALCLEAAAVYAPVRPGLLAFATAQDREHERRWLEQHGIPVAPWRSADTRDELASAVRDIGDPCYVKPRLRRAGDTGPVLVRTERDAAAAWIALGGRACVVEQHLVVQDELSVLVARSATGEVRPYPPAISSRAGVVLQCAAIPAPLPDAILSAAQLLALMVAEKLQLEGLLAVELFLLPDASLVVNELVPSAHATYHPSQIACATGQFEQLIRAVTGLPLGKTEAIRAAATVPLRGDLWDPRVPDFSAALRFPGVRLHLYGSQVPAPTVVAGHLTAAGHSTAAALRSVLMAARQLDRRRDRRVSKQRGAGPSHRA